MNNQAQTRKATLKAISLGPDRSQPGAEIRRRAAQTVNINAFHEILPNPENRLVLSSEHKDALGIPRPQITYDVGDYVRRSAAHTREVYGRIAALFGGTEIDYRRHLRAEQPHHGRRDHGRAIRRAPSSTRTCRTHDHENLYLATSGVMASAGSVNCTLTLAALSLQDRRQVKASL